MNHFFQDSHPDGAKGRKGVDLTKGSEVTKEGGVTLSVPTAATLIRQLRRTLRGSVIV